MPGRNIFSWSGMIGGYVQNGLLDEAMKLFQKMGERDVVSWNAVIAGYAQNGHFNEALKLFRQMQLIGVKPNSVTYISVLPACASLADLENGREVHGNMVRSGSQADVSVGSALVDMYATCGTIENACQVFDKMSARNVVSWNAMTKGHAINGCGEEALQFFEQMQHSGTEPNHVTFVGVLSACCHADLVDEGWHCFDQMSQDYHNNPTADHYCCMIDLHGCAGHLDEVQHFISKMPIKPDVAVRGSLLGASRIHANIELGARGRTPS